VIETQRHHLYRVISKELRNQDFLYKLGDNLKKIRKEKGLSQEQLGLDAELGKNQIGCIERGENNPTICSLVAIAKVLDVEVGELVNV